MKGLSRICPANITSELREKIRFQTELAYKIFNCNGVIRVDYLINKQTNEIYLNEINSIPGSFAYYLFESVGIYYSQLIDMIIENGIDEFNKKQKLKNSIDNIIFKKN